jgi:hypothetical protein
MAENPIWCKPAVLSFLNRYKEPITFWKCLIVCYTISFVCKSNFSKWNRYSKWTLLGRYFNLLQIQCKKNSKNFNYKVVIQSNPKFTISWISLYYWWENSFSNGVIMFLSINQQIDQTLCMSNIIIFIERKILYVAINFENK